MKYFVLRLIGCIGMYIVLVSSVSLDVTQMRLVLAGDNNEVTEVVREFDVVTRDAQSYTRWEHMYKHVLIEPYMCKLALSRTGLSNALVQQLGWTCITSAGRCRLSRPLPINSSCCCSSACGYVGP
jgi:hypothetical protein